MNKVVRFTTFFDGWSPAFEVFPIMNAEGILVGGFTVIDGPVWKCFVASRGYSESLRLMDGNLYVHPVRDSSGAIVKLVLSAYKEDQESRQIKPEDE